MSALVNFVLVGPNEGKTIGFSKDHTGKTRYNFVEGVMQVHRSRVNGRMIKFLKSTYSAVLEGDVSEFVDAGDNGQVSLEGSDNGGNEVQENRDDSSGSEDLSAGLTAGQSDPAHEAAIELTGNDDAEDWPEE